MNVLHNIQHTIMHNARTLELGNLNDQSAYVNSITPMIF